jgi:MFS family permease
MATPQTAAAPTPSAPSYDRRMTFRAVVAAATGTTIEWYDFFLYGVAAALVFPQKFFPGEDPYVGTLLAFSTYFVGFASRPLGAVIFGHFGDRVGRKAALISTLTLMGVSTMAIGLVPDYARIGIWGAVLLTIFRVFQGIAVGGEWGGAVLMAGEWTDPKRRGFTTSFAQFGAPAGMVLANGALALMTFTTTEETFLAWGWRVPFLLSFVLVFVGLYIRLGVLESPVFAKLKQQGRVEKAPVVEVLKRNWREVILTALLRTGQQTPFYIFTTYDPALRALVRQDRTAEDHRDRVRRDDRLPVHLLRHARHERDRPGDGRDHPRPPRARPPVRAAGRVHLGELPRYASL